MNEKSEEEGVRRKELLVIHSIRGLNKRLPRKALYRGNYSNRFLGKAVIIAISGELWHHCVPVLAVMYSGESWSATWTTYITCAS